MKYLILALFVAAATAAPIEDNGPVELIVNGVPEGQPIDLSDVVDIKVKEHSSAGVVATNLLHPFTAAGIAEAAAAAVPEPVIEPMPLPNPIGWEVPVPQPVALPEPAIPVVVPEPVVLPDPVAPEVVIVPESVILPDPVTPEVVIVPEPVILPDPVAPEVVIVPEPVILPAPVAPEVASLPNGEIFNDGTVSVTVNTPQEAGVLSTIQSWFSLALNYISGETQTSHQIV